MLFIGITGGIGAGKSAVLDYLALVPGCQVMLADEIAHDLMEPGTECYKKLYEIYGPEGEYPCPIYQEDGHFDRPATARVIFGDEKQRIRFNQIVHPAVKKYVVDYAKTLKEDPKQKVRLLVFECALLLEENFDLICDESWYIYTTEENRRSRLKASRNYSDSKIDNIMKTQLSEQEFRKRCCEVIDNNGSILQTQYQLRQLLLARQIDCAL